MNRMMQPNSHQFAFPRRLATALVVFLSTIAPFGIELLTARQLQGHAYPPPQSIVPPIKLGYDSAAARTQRAVFAYDVGFVRTTLHAVSTVHEFSTEPQSVATNSNSTQQSCPLLAAKFTGKERDGETGLECLRAMYMPSAHLRFTSPDEPLFDQHQCAPQRWSLYSCVRNNPLRFTDPSGRDCVNLNSGTQGDDRTGTVCAGDQLGTGGNFTVGVDRDAVNFIMLQGIDKGLSSPHQIATIVCEAGQCAMALQGLASVPSLAPGSMRFARCPELIRLGLGDAAESAKALDKARHAIPLGNPELVRRAEQTLQDNSTGTQRYSRDGISLQSQAGKRPGQGAGYSQKYKVRSKAGVTSRGAEPVIPGQGGEVYDTPDRHDSIARIRES